MEVKNFSWPGWETVRLIGRGSFGAVYEIQRDVLGEKEKAAMKVISIPQNEGDIEEMYSDGHDAESITSTFQTHLKSIVSEYTLMRKMNGSANIVNCDDIRYIQHEDGFGWDIFIKMELLTPLTKALSVDITEETVITLAEDLCTALVLCERNKIVHRDIKPQNIFVSDNGDYKLGDFGIAKTVEKTMGGTKIGTYKYMAPEVYNNQPYGRSADIYSLGLVLYWLLNERRMPFLPLPPERLGAGMEDEARSRRLSGEPLPPPAHGSQALKRIVMRACAPAPGARYDSAYEMLQALYALQNKPVTPVSVSAAPGALAVPASDTAKTPDEIPQELTAETKDGTVGLFADRKNMVAEESQTARKSFEDGPPVSKKTEAVRTEKKTVRQKKTRGVWYIIGILMLIIIVILLLRRCGMGARTPEQTQWSQWMEQLPESVNAEDYEIETQTLYRSRSLQTATSVEQSSMEGWELYDTVAANSGYGPWSEWSLEATEATDTRNVETQERYRFSKKETATGTEKTMSGWELYDTTYSWSDYGSWSSWSTEAVSASASRQVETKTQYSYRDVWITQEYSDWSSWSSWSTTQQTTGDLRKGESRTVWGYYFYLCPSCGAHMHVYTQCYTWAGGCGKSNIHNWNEIWSTTSWSNAGLKDWYGTGHTYTYIDGNLVFKWSDGNGDPKTQYRYATRTLEDVTNYGSWSSYSDTQYTASSSREVRTRTVYRYRDRTEVPTYHFYRWGSWSDWSAEAVSGNDGRRVESAVFYRYQDLVEETTYYFRRWGEWSEYTLEPVSASDTQEVESVIQYRYRSKT